jgi:hypothetical protein
LLFLRFSRSSSIPSYPLPFALMEDPLFSSIQLVVEQCYVSYIALLSVSLSLSDLSNRMRTFCIYSVLFFPLLSLPAALALENIVECYNNPFIPLHTSVLDKSLSISLPSPLSLLRCRLDPPAQNQDGFRRQSCNGRLPAAQRQFP